MGLLRAKCRLMARSESAYFLQPAHLLSNPVSALFSKDDWLPIAHSFSVPPSCVVFLNAYLAMR